MPPNRQVGRLVHLLEGFLDFVLAEVDLPAVGGCSDVVGGEGLRDGDESNGRRVAPDPAGRSRDSLANVGQPGTERGGISHAPLGGYRVIYCGSCAASAFAWRAFGPLGASLRYVSNSPRAPLRLPSLTSAMPSW